MSLLKDCLEVWNLLYDHQPFIQNQLISFVKEFETKRSDREVDNLLETLKNLCEIDDIQCNKLKSFDLANIKTLIKNVDKRTDFASAILEQSEKYTTTSRKETRRKFLEVEWESFKQELDNKYLEADLQFKLEQDRLRQHYEELNNKIS